MPIFRQKLLIYLMFFSVGFSPAGSIWVLLLAMRGFSLVEIGMAEAVFHVTSLLCEVPSGVLTDLWGRKKVMVASVALFLVSALAMAAGTGMAGVCFAMVLKAIGCNLQSGTLEALNYESLLQAGQEDSYLSFSATLNALWRLSDGAGMLLAGATVLLGWRTAYLIDAAVCLLGLLAALGLVEPECPGGTRRTVSLRGLPSGVVHTLKESASLLRREPWCARVMLVNALIGAVATLTRFFLQERIEGAVPHEALLGPALFLLSLGGVAGSLLAKPMDRIPYRRAAALSLGAVCACALLARGQVPAVLPAAGVLSGVMDDAIQIVSDRRVNDVFPSEQRATLVSLGSLTYSLVMIPLSPVFGMLFTR